MQQNPSVRDTNSPPPFFSMDFHLRFFPLAVRRIAFPGKGAGGTASGRDSGFSSTAEHVILFAAAMISLAAGLPAALGNGSLIGLFFSVAGAAGVIALVAASVAARKGYEPVFDDFRILTFLFCVFLGLTCGLGLGLSLGPSYAPRLLLGAAGSAGGYVAGIFAGLWAPRLGWIAGLLDLLAGLCVLSFVIIDIILLM